MTKITLVVPDRVAEDLKDMSMHDARYLLMDALYEFRAHRLSYTPYDCEVAARDYVTRRYAPAGAGSAYPEGPAREKKIQQVAQRLRWANALHSGDICQIEFNVPEEG